MTVKT